MVQITTSTFGGVKVIMHFVDTYFELLSFDLFWAGVCSAVVSSDTGQGQGAAAHRGPCSHEGEQPVHFQVFCPRQQFCLPPSVQDSVPYMRCSILHDK